MDTLIGGKINGFQEQADCHMGERYLNKTLDKKSIPRTNISTPMFLSLLACSSTGSWDFPSVMIMATLGKAFLDPAASVKMFCRR